MARIEEWELWACANTYVKKYGAEAPLEAAARADELLETGDVEGASTFSKIAGLAEQLLTKPAGPLH